MADLRPRSDWTSSAPGGSDYSPGNYRGIAIHWPASAGSYAGVTDAQARATLNAWRDYHMGGRGWSDIAYQYAVTPDGVIWTLRGMGRKSGANGGTGPNDAFGAVILFLGPVDPVTPAMRDAVRWLRSQYLAAGTGTQVITHNQARQMFGLGGTACPGPAASAAVERGDFSSAAPPDEPIDPPGPPEPPEEDDDMIPIIVRRDDGGTAAWLLQGGRKIYLANETNVQALVSAGAVVLTLQAGVVNAIPSVGA